MTETPEHPPASTATTATPPASQPTQRGGPSRLAQVALWVAIVAGVLFIVSAVFLSGFLVGKHSGPCGRYHDDGGAVVFHRGHPKGPGMMPGMMGPGGPVRPGGPPGVQGRPPGPGQPPTPPPAGPRP